MKVGIRKPSAKKSFSARTTGKVKRKLKRMTNPFYGKKGIGWIKNPTKAFKSKIYRKTTISTKQLSGCIIACFWYPIYFSLLLCWWCLVLMWWVFKYFILAMWWLCVLIINGVIALIEILINLGRDEISSEVIDLLPEDIKEV